MLRSLRIQQFVIVDDLSIEFSPGFNVLSGETGAGKSILIDALGLVLGQRGDRSLIRSGQPRATVQADYAAPPESPAFLWAHERGLIDEDGDQLTVRRELAREGNQRAFINGTTVRLSQLRELGALCIQVHGQHEQQTLLDSRQQLELLDRFGGHQSQCGRVADLFDGLMGQQRRLQELEQAGEERLARQERLQRMLDEIDAVDPQPGELERLAAERQRLQHAEELRQLIDGVLGDVHEGEHAAVASAFAGLRHAQRIAALDASTETLAQRLESAALELQDLGEGFRDYRERIEVDPDRLEEVEGRRAGIERLCLHYGEDETAVREQREQLARELSGLENLDDELASARSKLAKMLADYASAAQQLSTRRKRAAQRLAKAVEAQFRGLALGAAKFGVAFTPAPAAAVADCADIVVNRNGHELAEFQLAANPGEPLRDLAKVASGGELSRTMLALHGVFEQVDSGRVLIFDEVDAGIGGAAADTVGARLAELAQRNQVLCVTHLAQVAAYANHQFVVQKQIRGQRTSADVRPVCGDARVDELARMLAGDQDSALSQRHAHELLAARGKGQKPSSRKPAARRDSSPLSRRPGRPRRPQLS